MMLKDVKNKDLESLTSMQSLRYNQDGIKNQEYRYHISDVVFRKVTLGVPRLCWLSCFSRPACDPPGQAGVRKIFQKGTWKDTSSTSNEIFRRLISFLFVNYIST